MNEKINIAEILKDCPEGTKLWSPLYGEVTLIKVGVDYNESYYVYGIYVKTNKGAIDCFSKQGKYNAGYKHSECMLFPSKENRDWSTFKPKKPKFDPNTLKPFDKVLVRNLTCNKWECDFFSHDNICCFGRVRWDYCIPYNEETKHLVGSSKDAPEYYRYWED